MKHTISPVRFTVSPSLTRRSDPKSTTPTCPASRFIHMPFTPDANLPTSLALVIPHKSSQSLLTPQAPQPGHCSFHALGQYHPYKSRVSNLSSPRRGGACFGKVGVEGEKGRLAHPTERTRPVSARPASSCTPLILCSRIEETSVGEARASAA